MKAINFYAETVKVALEILKGVPHTGVEYRLGEWVRSPRGSAYVVGVDQVIDPQWQGGPAVCNVGEILDLTGADLQWVDDELKLVGTPSGEVVKMLVEWVEDPKRATKSYRQLSAEGLSPAWAMVV